MIARIVIKQCSWVNTFFPEKEKLTIPANRPHTPTMNRMLKTADPTMVPTPTSLSAIKTPVKQQQRKFRQLRQRIFRLWQRKFRRLKGTCLIPARPTDWLTLLYLNWVKCPFVAIGRKKKTSSISEKLNITLLSWDGKTMILIYFKTEFSFLHNENISGCVVLIFLSMNICKMPLVKATQLID